MFVTLGRNSSFRLLVAFITKVVIRLPVNRGGCCDERWASNNSLCVCVCICVCVLKHHQHNVSARSSLALNFFPLALRSSVRLGNRLALSSAVGR